MPEEARKNGSVFDLFVCCYDKDVCDSMVFGGRGYIFNTDGTEVVIVFDVFCLHAFLLNKREYIVFLQEQLSISDSATTYGLVDILDKQIRLDGASAV